MPENLLYYGDNLDILRRHVKDDSVDLVYLDPPFNSNTDYNVIFMEQNGSRSASQLKAFADTWEWDDSAARAFKSTVEAGGKVAKALLAFREYLGDTSKLAYLAMMAPRLVELRRVLKSTGSVYLHCDPTTSHYLKMLMDAVFGSTNFRSEVIWSYRRWPTKTLNYQHMHDVLLYYSKSGQPTFKVHYESASVSFLKRFGGKGNRLEPGATTKHATAEETPGLPLRDVWEISIIAGSSKERLGYPTQKPMALLQRIIEVSSELGGTVLDPFCGCGTAVDAAQNMGRHWIGIDIAQAAIVVIKKRLYDRYGGTVKYEVIGEPISVPDARTLAAEKPYDFQWWALSLVGARPVEKKKGTDQGIDGRLYFHDEGSSGRTKHVILSVKAGHTNVAHIRDLRGVIDREAAEIGILLTMQEPTHPMRVEATSAGFYHSPGWNKDYPRIQILTVEQLLAGKGIDMPPLHTIAQNVDKTFRMAQKSTGFRTKTLALPFKAEKRK